MQQAFSATYLNLAPREVGEEGGSNLQPQIQGLAPLGGAGVGASLHGVAAPDWHVHGMHKAAPNHHGLHGIGSSSCTWDLLHV